ncbi:unnamed protein product [Rangifer tarandus platyrhynchus]|uniref:Uncharacterized protein n=2 Tax=Rangifer tarandus platyrhynchus TaxID=3082113 RepID=A0AC59Z9W8_RANTA|nr:unnamed protein product [Rangifer tarandus platyrhynchus]
MTFLVINILMCILLNQPTKESKNPKPQLNQCTAFALLSYLLGERGKAWKRRSSLLLWAPSHCSVLNGRGGGKVLNVGVGEERHGGPPGTPSISGQFYTRNSVEIEQAKFFYSSTLCHGGAPQRGTWVSLWALSEAGACPSLALPTRLAA